MAGLPAHADAQEVPGSQDMLFPAFTWIIAFNSWDTLVR